MLSSNNNIRFSINIFWFYLILFSMSTYITVAAGKDGLNYVLISVMIITPAILIKKLPKLIKSERLMYSIAILISVSALINYNSFRVISYFYSLFFILTFILYARILKSRLISLYHYLIIIKFLIVCFFIVLVVQQFCYITKIPIFNYRVGDLSVLKFNSLASEPSYLGRIVPLMMLSYAIIKGVLLNRDYSIFNDGKNDWKLWSLVFYQVIFSGSSFAFLMLLLVILRFSKVTLKILFLLPVLFATFLIAVYLYDPIIITRVVELGKAVFTFDELIILNIDASGGFRIAPTIVFLKNINPTSLEFWMGNGMDYTSNLMPDLLPGLDEYGYNVGLFPSFIMDFGVIATILLVISVWKYGIYKKLDFIIWLVIILDAPFNTQLFWLTMLLLFSNKYFYKNPKSFPAQYAHYPL